MKFGLSFPVTLSVPSKFQLDWTAQARVIDFVVYWCVIAIFWCDEMWVVLYVAVIVSSKFQPNRTSQARVIDFVVYWCVIAIFWCDEM